MLTERNVLTYLEHSARKDPDACAVIDEHGELSYAALRQRAQQAGTALAQRGARKRAVVVYLEKSAAALAVMFGALYAGGFYVPVDPRTPPARVSSMCAMLDNPLIVVGPETPQTSKVPDFPATIDIKDLFGGPVDSIALQQAREATVSTDPAYILFTSGSTGAPKGVIVSHQAVLDFIDAFTSLFRFWPDDHIGNQAPFDFDVSVKDIYATLACGATLVIIPRRLFSEPAALVAFLNGRRITIMIWAVAALCLITSLHGLEGTQLPYVRAVLFSGEAMPPHHLKTWIQHAPNATFVNLYGPTEITCNCSYHVVDRRRDYADGIPLGNAFPNRELMLVDDTGALATEPGQEGEIFVRGSSLAIGYVGRPDLTDQAFVQNPLHRRFPDRTYRTGDRARISATGELLFLGRADAQIKLQGHRIELEEIDRTLERMPGVRRCRCAFDRRRNRLHAFFEGEAEETCLLDELRKTFPAPMVPRTIVRVDSMPLNKNGKVDRARLLEQALSPSRTNGRTR